MSDDSIIMCRMKLSAFVTPEFATPEFALPNKNKSVCEICEECYSVSLFDGKFVSVTPMIATRFRTQ